MLLLYHGIKGEYGILNFCMFPYSGIFFFSQIKQWHF